MDDIEGLADIRTKDLLNALLLFGAGYVGHKVYVRWSEREIEKTFTDQQKKDFADATTKHAADALLNSAWYATMDKYVHTTLEQITGPNGEQMKYKGILDDYPLFKWGWDSATAKIVGRIKYYEYMSYYEKLKDKLSDKATDRHFIRYYSLKYSKLI